MSEKDAYDIYQDTCDRWEINFNGLLEVYNGLLELHVRAVADYKGWIKRYESLADSYAALAETYKRRLEDNGIDTELDEEDMLLVDELMEDNDEDLDAYLDFAENELPEVYDGDFEELDFSEFDEPEEEFSYIEDELWPLNGR